MKRVIYIAVSVDSSLLKELNAIIKTNLYNPVSSAKKSVDIAVEKTAVRLKSWAMENMQSARAQGFDPLFKKIINNPTEVAKQLVKHMMGTKTYAPSVIRKPKLTDPMVTVPAEPEVGPDVDVNQILDKLSFL